MTEAWERTYAGATDEAYVADALKRATRKLEALQSGAVEARTLGRLGNLVA